MKAQIEIDDDKIKNLLISAFEGGANYWIDFVEVARGYGIYEAPFGAYVKVHPHDEEKGYLLTRKNMERGIQLMSEKYTHHFADLINENDDAITGDVFLQLCLFGELIYG